ncbi:hypothetical protein QI554_37520 [Yinghuangia seranimata]|nr:hypothetical protein [Yinghuangia seranimata]MDI2131843.1 hypothetical protein [Yinghuangia seranimata]
MDTAAEPEPHEDMVFEGDPGDPAAVEPLDVVPPEPTGDAGVDQAVGRLTQTGVLATDQHAEVYEDVHRELREILTGLDR